MNYEPAINEQGRDSEQWPAPGAKASMSGADGMNEAVNTDRIADDDEEDLPTPELLMSYSRAAVQLADTSDQGMRRNAMVRSWRSFNNQHSTTSRYSQDHYKSRSRLFVPKIRSIVYKNAIATAQALFSTNDVVEVSGTNERDPRQRASASVIKALLNYRLDRTSGRSGIPWFWIAIAAAIETQVSGVVISKQFWEYEYVVDRFDPASENVAAFPTGEVAQTVTKKRIILDRPKIDLHPPENVIVDMAAPFWDVIQGGAFLIVKHAMHVGDVRNKMKEGRNHMGGGAWFNVPEKTLRGSVVDYANTAVRTARDKGRDNLASSATPNINDLQIVWVHENFVRYGGRDYQFWSLGTTQLLSDPIETDEAYPAHHGNRPYTMGVGCIEPHNVMPMSPVEAVQPLQDELNDHRNLSVDVMRQTVAPIAKIRRGAKIDFRQLRKRGPETNILVNEPDDVTFEMPPANLGTAYQMQDRIANEMDELGGSFSNSSVQQNRNLNETVGGMKLMSQSAGGKQEFDVRVFSETWAEETLRQVTWLEQYYETDDRILAVAGEKAQLFQKHQIDPAQDPDGVRDLLDCDVTLKLSVGTGASDPNMRLQKLIAGLKTLYEMAAGGAFGGQVTAKAKEIFDEVMALTGYPEAERFFEFISPEDAEAKKAQQPNPEMEKLGLEKDKAAKEHDIKGRELQLKDREIGIKEQDAAHTRAMGARDIGLRTAGQNKQLIDEATGEAKEVMEPQEAREPLPVEKAMGDTMMQLTQMMAGLTQALTAIAQGQQQMIQQQGGLAEALNALAQGQQQMIQAQAENRQMAMQILQRRGGPQPVQTTQ